MGPLRGRRVARRLLSVPLTSVPREQEGERMSAHSNPVHPSGTWKRVGSWLTRALGLLLAAGPIAVWLMFFSPSLPWGPDMTGLDGVWHEEKNPQHFYAFRKDGKLLWKTKALVFGDLMWDEF